MTDPFEQQRLWWDFGCLALGRRRWLILVVALLSLLAGFTEATALFLVIRGAAALAGSDAGVLSLPVLAGCSEIA